MSLIKLTNISKNYAHANVLKNINLQINRGEFIAIVGKSGSGKSTLMNILGCLDTPSSGKYFIENSLVSNLSSDELATIRGKKFGFIFQKYNLLSNLNAFENVELPAIYQGTKADIRAFNAKKLLANLDLADKISHKPSELSGGQQQRVSIARSLMNGAEVILADEPTGALDSKSGQGVMSILCELNKIGHTIILVTHDAKVASFASRIIEIKDGEIISDTQKDKKNPPTKNENLSLKRRNFALKDIFIQSIKIAINSLLSHKLRTILTMLGIIIGIASVVCIVALGRGSQDKILADINKIGTNTIVFFPGKSFGDMFLNRTRSLDLGDLKLIEKQNFVQSVTPNIMQGGKIMHKNLTFSAMLSGGNDQSINVEGLEIQSGRNISEDDVLSSNSVCIISQSLKNSLFKDTDAIGKIVLFNNRALKVVGVLKHDDNLEKDGTLTLFAPYTTLMNKISSRHSISSISVRIKNGVNSQVAQKLLENLIATRHGKKDFHTLNIDSIKQTVTNVTNTMSLLISSIAVISLIVGGIGVMNIMLVSVTQRTKEIGLKIAIGAKKSDIMLQFLLEAILICLIGGILGILLSFCIGWMVGNFLQSLAFSYSFVSVFLALISSMFIGVIFGFIPAKNAAKLNPVEALLRE